MVKRGVFNVETPTRCCWRDCVTVSRASGEASDPKQLSCGGLLNRENNDLQRQLLDESILDPRGRENDAVLLNKHTRLSLHGLKKLGAQD